MSVDVMVPVTIARVEVSDAYLVEVTVTDPTTMSTVTTWLRWEEAEAFADEIRQAVADASSALAADQAPPAPPLGFDVDTRIVCRECDEGKHGACNGSALVFDQDDSIAEVTCACSASTHRIREARA